MMAGPCCRKYGPRWADDDGGQTRTSGIHVLNETRYQLRYISKIGVIKEKATPVARCCLQSLPDLINSQSQIDELRDFHLGQQPQ